jgi:hypothetical protein
MKYVACNTHTLTKKIMDKIDQPDEKMPKALSFAFYVASDLTCGT